MSFKAKIINIARRIYLLKKKHQKKWFALFQVVEIKQRTSLGQDVDHYQ